MQQFAYMGRLGRGSFHSNPWHCHGSPTAVTFVYLRFNLRSLGTIHNIPHCAFVTKVDVFYQADIPYIEAMPLKYQR